MKTEFDQDHEMDKMTIAALIHQFACFFGHRYYFLNKRSCSALNFFLEISLCIEKRF